jgi:hypothetical protein
MFFSNFYSLFCDDLGIDFEIYQEAFICRWVDKIVHPSGRKENLKHVVRDITGIV